MSTTMPTGQIMTFYSYKGGTGRSMALANVACLLARKCSEGESVLMIDWDLEAPGLHRFFQGKLVEPSSENGDLPCDEHLGLLDLFQELDQEVYGGTTEATQQAEEEAKETMRGLNLDRFILSTTIPCLKLMKAGRFDDGYAARVNGFQWEALYHRSPWLIRAFAERLMERHRYVLIDSRTGFTDISGICTMLMPERLVAVFTPNRQSLDGVLKQVQRATDYRRQSDDLRPLVVFPLPARIEAAEPQLREDWRLGNQEKGLLGYQPQFETFFKEAYGLSACNLQNYFDEVQIQHLPRYAYGEEIAVLVERAGDRLSLSRSYESFTERLLELAGPWEERVHEEEQNEAIEEPTEPIDVFIDYDVHYFPEARTLAKALRRRGFHPWIIHEHIPPGRPFRAAVEKAIAQAKAVVVLVGAGSDTGFASIERRAREEEIRKKKSVVIPVVLPGSDLDFLSPWRGVNPIGAKTIDDEDVLDQLEWGITGKKPDRKIPRPFDPRRTGRVFDLEE